MSEVILHFKYLGLKTVKGRKIMTWQIQVFVELWNHTNFPVRRPARVSYENKLNLPRWALILQEPRRGRFVVGLKTGSATLEKIGDQFWSPEFNVDLAPNEYKFYNPVTLDYTIDLGSVSVWSEFNIDRTGLRRFGNYVDVEWKGSGPQSETPSRKY